MKKPNSFNKKDQIRFAMVMYREIYGERISYTTLARVVGIPIWILIFLLCQIGWDDIRHGCAPMDILAVDDATGQPGDGFRRHKIKIGHLGPDDDFDAYCDNILSLF